MPIMNRPPVNSGSSASLKWSVIVVPSISPRTSMGGAASTLCAGSAARPAWPSTASACVAFERIVPPLSSSVSASTAMPSGASSGAVAVQAKVSVAVPEPLSYAAQRSPAPSSPPRSSFSHGVPPVASTSTASPKVSCTRTFSPAA